MTPRSVRLEPLSVGELVHGGPLAGAVLVTGVGLDRPVHRVRLVESLEEVRDSPPHSAVVLHRDAAHSGWAMESAMLDAWERAVACVVAPAANLRTRSIEELSRRLGVELIGVEGAMSEHALAIAAAVANPEAARAGIVARCALKLAEAGSAPRSLVGTLNHELPGVRVALVSPDGTVVAGRAEAAHAQAHPQDLARVVHVDVPGPDGTVLATLVAALSRWSPAWAETVRSILRIATAPVATAIVTRQTRLILGAEHARLLFESILATEDADPPFEWPLRGGHVGVVVVPAVPRASADLDQLTPGIIGAWQDAGSRRPLIRYGEGWASWWTGRLTVPRVAADVRRLIGAVRSGVPLVAGIGEPGRDVPGLRTSLGQAAVAAAAARQSTVGPVASFGALGPLSVLAGLSRESLAGPARISLAAVLAVDDGMTLIETMVAVLDAGGSSGQAAARLGVHRNTITARLERLRQLGVDLADPRTRLALHVAGYALVNEP